MPAEFTKTITVRPATALEGVVRVPGDKSISHRYAMLAALAEGVTRISHYAPGNDCQSTLSVSRTARHRRLAPCRVRPRHGCGGADCSDSRPRPARTAVVDRGFGLRQLRVDAAHARRRARRAPVHERPHRRCLAAPPADAAGGDARSRPWAPKSRRSTDARRSASPAARCSAITYRPDTPSAQVKTAVLLAGLQTDGRDDLRGTGRHPRPHGTGAACLRRDRRRARSRHPRSPASSR